VEEQRSTAGQGIGIAGLILGIVAVPLAIIPCTFPLALILAAGGIILSAVGLSQASRVIGAKGLPVAGLVVSIIGMMIALMWGLVITTAIDKDHKFWKDGIIEKISKKVDKDIEGTFEDIDKEFEKIDKDLENVLEDLEWEEEWDNFNWGEEITDEEFDKVMVAYEDLIKNYTTLVDEAQKGKIAAVAEYTKVSAKALSLAAKITSIAPKLTEEQKARFEAVKQKYETALKEVEKLESEE
jgi:hypothetical protein